MGLTIVIAVVVLCVLIFFSGDFRDLFRTRRELIVLFPQGISGEINTGSDVRYAGARIGAVTAVDVKDKKVEFHIEIYDDVDLRTNSRATVKSVGFLGGDKYLNITPGTSQAPLLKSGDIIIGEEQMAMDELFDSVSQIARNTEQITTSVDHLLATGDQPGDLIITLYKTQRLLDEVNSAVANVNRMVTTNERHIKNMVDQVSGITDQVNVLLESTTGKVDTTLANVQMVTAQLPQILGDVRTVLKDVQTITQRIQASEGTAGQLIKDDELHIKIQQLIDNTDALINQIKTSGIRIRLF